MNIVWFSEDDDDEDGLPSVPSRSNEEVDEGAIDVEEDLKVPATAFLLLLFDIWVLDKQ